MPVIRISDDTFALLQQVAQPLVDTPDSAIRKALGVYLASNKTGTKKVEPVPPKPNGSREFDPNSPPDLTHTGFLTGEVAGKVVSHWNHLLVESHVFAYNKLDGDLSKLQSITEANIRYGDITESGYKPAGNCGFSVQGVESNKAWAFSLVLAKKLAFAISAEFRWPQQKEGVAYPGEIGRIAWTPLYEMTTEAIRIVTRGFRGCYWFTHKTPDNEPLKAILDSNDVDMLIKDRARSAVNVATVTARQRCLETMADVIATHNKDFNREQFKLACELLPIMDPPPKDASVFVEFGYPYR